MTLISIIFYIVAIIMIGAVFYGLIAIIYLSIRMIFEPEQKPLIQVKEITISFDDDDDENNEKNDEKNDK